MTLSFFSCSRSVLLCSIIILGVFFLFGHIGITHAATPVPPTLQSPANTWATTITTNNVNLTWSYPALDPSIWFYLYIVKWDSSALTWKPYLSKYVGVTTQDSETFTDGFYAWQLAAVDISQQSNPWYKWANDWNKLKVGAGATPTPTPVQTPTPTPGGSPTPTPVGPTYYISPNGLDTNPGTAPTAPLKTFNKAIPLLKPGYTLMLMNGTYTQSTTGLPLIKCGTNAVNGTASNYITIKAQNERQAILRGDGSIAEFAMGNCSYWNVEGITAIGADNVNCSSQGLNAACQAFIFDHITNVNMRKLLAQRNNRYYNTALIAINNNSSHFLLEDSEVYNFARWGIETIGTNDFTMRRNYSNSRLDPELTCHGTAPNLHCDDGTYTGDASKCSGKTAGAYCAYQGQNYWGRGDFDGAYTTAVYGDPRPWHAIIENNIGENNGNDWAGCVTPQSDPIKCKFLGNIVINNTTGLGGTGDCSSPSCQPGGGSVSGTSWGDMFENEISFNDTGTGTGGFYEKGSANLDVHNFTLIKGTVGFGTDNAWMNTNSITAYNILSLNNSQYGFNVTAENPCSVTYSSASGNSINFNTPGCTTSNNNTNAPTNFYNPSSKQGCIVYIPMTSNMHNAGKGGTSVTGASMADIGANIIYRYQDGILTNQKLWNQSTGQFPCGATVSGVNDIAGSSCFDVNKRLNVGVNGCPIP